MTATRHLSWPGTALPSALAALTTWLTLLSWTGFAQQPSGYLVPILGGCVLVAVSGMLLRSARLPAVAVLAVQVLVLGLWLHHSWAGDAALGGWLPTGDSLHRAAATLADSARAAQAYAAPVPKSVPAFNPLMVALGCSVAVLVDLLACGLRRAPLAGLPLLAVYTAPISILDGGVSWLKFALAAVSFLFLVASEEALRLAGWGQQLGGTGQVFDSQATTVRSQAVWSSARKIGLTATGLAVIVPLFVPTLSGSLLDGHGPGPGGKGDLVDISNPIVDMKRDLVRGADVELLRVRTNDPDPSYLRVSVLDEFDGKSWHPSGRSIPVSQRADGPVAHPPGLEPGVSVRSYSYALQASSYFRSRWLPAPYPTSVIHAPGDWRYDRSTLDFISVADGQTAAGLSYRLRALNVAPTAQQLMDAAPAPSDVFGPMTRLPSDLPASIGALARKVTAGSTSKFDAAVRLQQWFRSGGHFRYSLQRASGNGVDELVHFLGTGPDSRVGYCEQFAAAMAVMGRTLKIPSRVAVGFLHPTPTAAADTFVYSTHDMHAWPEMYFDGVGWVRFEPTPPSRTGTAPAYTRAGVTAPQPLPSAPSSAAAPQRNRFDTPAAAPGASAAARHATAHRGSGRLLGAGLGLLLLLLLLALPRLLRGAVRRRRWATATGAGGAAEAGWAELRDSALDLGIAWDDHVTVRRRAHDLVRSFGSPTGEQDAFSRAPLRGPATNPQADAALDRLVRRVERVRYARSSSELDGSAAEIEADTRCCVDALRAGSSRRRRTRATWLPASLWRSRAAASRRARDAQPALTAEPGVDHAV